MDNLLELRNHPLGDYFTGLFHLFTFTGEISFFLVFLPLGFWFGKRPAFARATLLLLFTALFNSLLKAIFQEPRPDILHLAEASGWSFPSGHTQAAAALWPWLVLESRRPRWWPAAFVMVFGVALSRVYLGVHFPRDVIAGMAIGGGTVLLGWPLSLWFRERWSQTKPGLLAAALVLALAVYFLLFPAPVDLLTATVGGALAGFGLTLVLVPGARNPARLTFPPPSFGRLLTAALFGLLVAFGLRIGLKPLLASTGVAPAVAAFVRYGVIGVWLAGLAPACFVALGFARREATSTSGRAEHSETGSTPAPR